MQTHERRRVQTARALDSHMQREDTRETHGRRGATDCTAHAPLMRISKREERMHTHAHAKEKVHATHERRGQQTARALDAHMQGDEHTQTHAEMPAGRSKRSHAAWSRTSCPTRGVGATPGGRSASSSSDDESETSRSHGSHDGTEPGHARSRHRN